MNKNVVIFPDRVLRVIPSTSYNNVVLPRGQALACFYLFRQVGLLAKYLPLVRVAERQAQVLVGICLWLLGCFMVALYFFL